MLGVKTHTQPPKSSGFTLVELLVIAPIVILTIGAFITVIVSMTGDVLASRANNVLTYSIQDTLNRIEQDVKLSSGFLAENNITKDSDNPLKSPQGFANDDTTNFENVDTTNKDMLILSALATTGNPISTSTGLIYLPNQPNSCTDSQVIQNKPMVINIVYFVKDGSLWRRVIMPDQYTTLGCSAPWQQPSCNPTFMNTNPSGSTFCKTQDIRLIDNINPGDFTLQYYANANSVIPNAVASDTTKTATERNAALQPITTVAAILNISNTVAGRTISQTGTIRATKLDINASSIAAAIVPVTPSVPNGVAATFTTPSQITVRWNPNATSYNIQYANNSSFTGASTVNNITGSSYNFINLTEPQYYFRVSSTNSAGTSGWSSSVSAFSTITSGLFAWWMMNGNANTAVGSSNGSVFGASPTSGQNGQSNGAYSFDGVDDYISIPTIPSFPTNTMSISFWAYPRSTSANSTVLIMTIPNVNTNRVGVYFPWGANVLWDFGSDSTRLLPAWNSSWQNQWSYWVFMASPSGRSIYRNGTLLANNASTANFTGTASFYFGRSETTANNWNGNLDDVRFYNRTLTVSEIQALYNNGAR